MRILLFFFFNSLFGLLHSQNLIINGDFENVDSFSNGPNWDYYPKNITSIQSEIRLNKHINSNYSKDSINRFYSLVTAGNQYNKWRKSIYITQPVRSDIMFNINRSDSSFRKADSFELSFELFYQSSTVIQTSYWFKFIQLDTFNGNSKWIDKYVFQSNWYSDFSIRLTKQNLNDIRSKKWTTIKTIVSKNAIKNTLIFNIVPNYEFQTILFNNRKYDIRTITFYCDNFKLIPKL
jgi:hypothetical protein